MDEYTQMIEMQLRFAEEEKQQAVAKAYEQGRADAERDFQNSDYWNDYLEKVIADARADEREKILGFVNWKSEQNIRTRVVNIRIEHAAMLNDEQIIKIIAEQLKEKK